MSRFKSSPTLIIIIIIEEKDYLMYKSNTQDSLQNYIQKIMSKWKRFYKVYNGTIIIETQYNKLFK